MKLREIKTVSTMHHVILSRLSAIQSAKILAQVSTDDVSEYQLFTIR